jgi:hypothetical protein
MKEHFLFFVDLAHISSRAEDVSVFVPLVFNKAD